MNRLKKTIQDIGKYTELRLEYAKYSVQYAVVMAISAILSILLFVIPFALFLFFVSLGVGYWLGVNLGGLHWGVLIIALFYLALGFFFYFCKKQIAHFLVGYLVDIFPQEQEESVQNTTDQNTELDAQFEQLSKIFLQNDSDASPK